ncbi:MAG: hypothetical protein K2I43_04045, partial [Alistipes sp.]|nr:hypothetical protein [Alistipes sp.]
AFDHTSGRDMSGSMFIRPGYYPIDVMEFTPGRKDRQSYSFDGGLSADISDNWRIGAAIEFEAQNYAKRKDLRHTNYRLDMTLTPSVMYRNGRMAAGVSYIFNKNSERVSAEEVGSSSAGYYAFLDKGLMFGACEIWTGSGTHLNESGVDGLPVREFIHGAAVQFSVGGFYADAEYRYGSGSVGEKLTEWFRFPSHRATVHLGYRFRGGESLHTLRLRFDYSTQTSYEKVLGRETQNGITTTVIYGENRIFERTHLVVNPEYRLDGPRFEFRSGAEIEQLRRLASHMYPHLFSHSMIRSRVYMRGVLALGAFDLGASASFAAGSAVEKSRTEDTGMETSEVFRLDDYYLRQNEWFTAPRFTAEVSLRYTFRRGIFAEACAGVTRGFGTVHIGDGERWYETLKIGYTF